MTRAGMKIVLTNPEGYELMPALDEIAQMQAADSGGRLDVVDSIEGPSKRWMSSIQIVGRRSE